MREREEREKAGKGGREGASVRAREKERQTDRQADRQTQTEIQVIMFCSESFPVILLSIPFHLNPISAQLRN